MDLNGNKKVNLHLYRKAESRVGGNDVVCKAYIDNNYVCSIMAGERKELEITPGRHIITIEDNRVIKEKHTQEVVINEDSTDVYFAFKYGVSGGKYIRHSINLTYIEQYNNNLLYSDGEPKVKIIIHRMPTQFVGNQKSNYQIIIDDEQQYTGMYDSDLEFYISPGKHKFFYETADEIKYSFIDVPNDCEKINMAMIIDYNGVNIIKANQQNENIASTSGKQVECIISRARKFAHSAVRTTVLIDGNTEVTIKNGETKKINISTGNHMLIVKGTQTVTRELNVPEDCNRVYINLVYSNEITSIRTE